MNTMSNRQVRFLPTRQIAPTQQIAPTRQITATAPRDAAQGRSRLRLTARGRFVIGTVIALLVVSLIAVAALFAATQAQASTTAGEASFSYIVAGPGDSLWSLATEVAPSADTRDVIIDFMRLNQLSSSDLEVGQELAIPLKYSAN